MSALNERTRDSLEMLLGYWRETPSPFREEMIGRCERLLASDAVLDDERLAVYLERLEGPEGCDFKDDPEHGYVWSCGGTDKSRSQAILESMGLDAAAIEAVHELVDLFGGHCDCEIVFNAAPRMLVAYASQAEA